MLNEAEADQPSSRPLSWCGAMTRVVLRHRVLFALASVLTSALLGGAALTRLTLQSGIERMIDDAARPPLALGERPFVVDDEVAVVTQGKVFTREFIARLRALQQELETLQLSSREPMQPPKRMFERATSLLDAHRIAIEGDVLEAGTLADVLDRGLPSFAHAALGDPNIVGRFVDAAGSHALILLRTRKLQDRESVAVNDAVRAIVARHERPDFHIEVAGLPVLKAMITAILYKDAMRLSALAIGFALIVLLVTFRNFVGVLGPGLVIIQTLASMFGAMALCGVPLTIVGLYLPGLVAVISIMDAIHIQSLYRSMRAQGRAQIATIVEAASIAGAPMLYTAGTTCLGLLSLRVARLEAVRDLGTFGALGIAAAVLHTLITIPLVLSLHRGGALGLHEIAGQAWFERLIERAERLSRADTFGPRVWVGLALALAIASGAGISRLQVRHETMEWLPTGNSLAPAVAAIDDHLCGAASMTVLLDFGQVDALRRSDTLARLARIEADVRAYRDPSSGAVEVKDVSSLLDVVRAVWRAARDAEVHDELPADQSQTAGVFNLLELLGAREIDDFMSADGRRARMDVRLRWTDAGSYEQTIAYVRRAVAHELGPSVKYAIVGPVADMNRAVSSVLHDLVSSFGTGMVTIGLVLVAFVRSFRLGVLAMIPNVLPVAMTLGLMGFAGFPLDVHTMLLASVVLGIVDDDTIHFLHHFRIHFAETGDTELSVRHSFAHTSASLVVSGCTLALGFLTYLGASMHHIQRTAVLLAFAVLTAMMTDLVLTPALLRRYVRSRAQPAATGTVSDDLHTRQARAVSFAAEPAQADPIQHRSAEVESDGG